MATKYHQLTIEEREVIQQGLWEDRSLREIAHGLGRDPSTISRELDRNIKGEQRRYASRMAQERAAIRIQKRGRRTRLKNPLIREYVIKKLKEEDYSPEQVAGTL